MNRKIKLIVFILILFAVCFGEKSEDDKIKAEREKIWNMFSPAKQRYYKIFHKPKPDVPLTEKWTGIEKYPKVLQEYDSLGIIMSKKFRDNQHKSDELCYQYTKAAIRSKLFYSSLNREGAFNKYRDGHARGLAVRTNNTLPKKMNFLMMTHGIVLVKAIKDEEIDPDFKGGLVLGYPDNLVLYAKIEDDILDSIEEDTIMIRHCTDWFNNDFSIDNAPLFLLELNSTYAIVDGEKIEVYSVGYISDETPNYMYVDKDGIIHDPYNTWSEIMLKDEYNYYFLGDSKYELLNKKSEIDGMKYSDFKKEWQDFLIENGIVR